MSAKEIVEKIMDLVESNDEDGLVSVRTFEDAGLITRDEGIVISYDDGSQYQVTIVKS